MRVNCSRLNYDQEISRISKHSHCDTVLLQLNKRAFRPGEIVRARIFRLDSDRRLSQDPVEIKIRDGQGTTVADYKLKDANLGVFQTEFTIPDHIRELQEGTWEIEALSPAANFSQIFFVHNQILPNFNLYLDIDKTYVLRGEGEEIINVSVRAKYNYHNFCQKWKTYSI